MKRNEIKITDEAIVMIRANDSYKIGDFHQAMLDIAYDDWRDSHGEWTYYEMLMNARAKYGELVFVMTIAGKYNQQVGNGGHYQYFDNGYGSVEGGGCLSNHDPAMPLHREVIAGIKWLNEMYAEPVLEKALAIMSRVRILVDEDETTMCDCDECEGTGWLPDPGDNDGEDVRCMACDGRGQVECDNDDKGCVCNHDELNVLDNEWFEVDEEFMAAMNRIACLAIGGDAEKIHAAATAFEAAMKEVKNSGGILMNGDLLEGAAKECWKMLIEDNLRYKYIEQSPITGEARYYCANKVKRTVDDLGKTIRDMKPGEKLDYWKDIADMYDVEDPATQSPRLDIVEAYDGVLVECTERGYLVELHDDEDDPEITTGYERTDKK